MRSILARHLPKLKKWTYLQLGWPAIRCTEHSKLKTRWKIREPSFEEIANPLEGGVFRTPSVIRIEHGTGFLYALQDVALVGKEGYPFVDSNKVFAVCPSVKECPDSRMRRPVRAFSAHITEPVFHLTGPNAGNRAHFLIEQLPRLMASLPQLQALGEFRVLLNYRGVGWQPRLLSYLGIPTDWCLIGGKGTVRCDQLLYAPMLCANRARPLCCPDLLLEFKRRIETQLARMALPQRSAIFISRKDAPDRYLLNEDAVIDHLRMTWPELEAVCLTGMSVEEQAHLFHRTRVIVGPHGQGFHNTLFAQDSLIVQLMYGRRESDTDAKWCRVLNAVAHLGGNEAITLHSETKQDRDGNWTYPLDRLKQQLAVLQRVRANR